MLFKLSLIGLKSRFKDYAVLFSGLTLSAAIFYMFLTLATNNSFLKKTSPLSAQTTSLTFGLGIVLLAIITFVYIVYANSFLLSMRKRDYGMYLMLGAKNGKIGQLIFVETLLVGLLAAIVGIAIGIFLAQWLSGLLVKQFGLAITGFYGFYGPAAFWTLIFYAIIFFLASFWNRHKLVKTEVINLLHDDQKPIKIKHHPVLKTFEAICGVALLAIGYWGMANYMQLQTNSLWLGLITITLGSYFVFDSLFTAAIGLLQKNAKFEYHQLNAFTLGQLKFRLNDYTRILSVISILFALALGAITVGLNFNNLTEETLRGTYYDVVLFKQDKKTEQQTKKVAVKSKTGFDYKIVKKKNDKFLYVNQKQINQAKIKYAHFYQKNGQQAYQNRTITSQALAKGGEAEYQLLNMTQSADAHLKIVSKQQYSKIRAKQYHTELLTAADFRKNFTQIDKLQKLALPKRTAGVIDRNYLKTTQFPLINGFASGFEFMGFFLGIAFLAMLASTLMFKVLSGAAGDRPRYQMLYKIGTQKRLLKHSIEKEIGILFALPAVLGIIDVLLGLQFFKAFLGNPYHQLWLPFGIFLVLYLLYYLLTNILYQKIVFKRY